MVLCVRHGPAAEPGDAEARVCIAVDVLHAEPSSKSLGCATIRDFLQRDDVRCLGTNDGLEQRQSAAPAVPDVVGHDLHAHPAPAPAPRPEAVEAATARAAGL